MDFPSFTKEGTGLYSPALCLYPLAQYTKKTGANKHLLNKERTSGLPVGWQYNKLSHSLWSKYAETSMLGL